MSHSFVSYDNEISIWVVEDDIEYRHTIVYLLNHTSGMHCAKIFHSFEEVQALVEGKRSWEAPKVILMDIGLPGLNGIEGVSRLKSHIPQVPIVMLTVNDRVNVIFSALCAGASGYLLKDTPIDQILLAVREASHGGTLLHAPIANKVLEFFSRTLPRSDYGLDYSLTNREMDVLRLMGDGLAYKQMADELSLSPHTVGNHIRNIYRKLHVNSGIQAITKAIREGLI